MSKMVAKPAVTPEQILPAILNGVQPLYFQNGITATGSMGTFVAISRMLEECNEADQLKLKIGIYLYGKKDYENERVAFDMIISE